MASAGGNNIVAVVAQPKGSSTAKEATALSDGEDAQNAAAVVAPTEEEKKAKKEQDGETGKDPEGKWPDLGNSITQRCRKRLKWAENGCEETSSSYWVCKDADCPTELCKLHREPLEWRNCLNEKTNDLNEMRKELNEKRNELETAGQSRSEDQRIVQLLEKSIGNTEVLVHQSEVIVVYKCKLLLASHEHLKEVLIYGKDAGNKTSYKTEQTNFSQVQRALENADAEAADVDVDIGPKINKPESPSQLDPCSNEDCEIDPFDRGVFENNQELKEFWGFCDDMFRISQLVPLEYDYNSEGFAKCIEETCKYITDWKKDTTIDTNRTYYRPSGLAQETNAVQPILFALMWKISRILGRTMHLTKEQYLPRADTKKSKHWIDSMWSEVVNQHLDATNGSLLGKSIEMKPLSRKGDGKGFTKMVKEGENQAIGRMLQTLWDAAFQYCRGLGKDGRASGIVLTMASAMLLDANVSGIGTREAKLTSRSTGNQPLFSKATSKVLFTECGKGLDKSNLIFAASPDGGTERVMQKGFTNLVHFVMDLGNEEEEVDASAEIKGKEIKIKIGKFLGSGSFCEVHTARIDNEDTNFIVKIAHDKTHTVCVLKNELQVLKVLNHSSIPKLYTQSLVNLMVRQRCERNWVQGLVLQVDEGLTAGEACKRGIFLCRHIECVFEETKNALHYAHGQNCFHLDVQPSNIIIKTVGESEISVLLNDWGAAAQKPKTLKYYTGTPPFSHDDLLRTDPKKPFTQQLLKPEFDRFSLAMTICYLLNRGMPWNGINGPLVTQSMLDKRKTTALRLIEESQLSNTHKETLRADVKPSQRPKSDVKPLQSPTTVPVQGAALKTKPLATNAETSSSKRRRTTPERLTY